MVAALASRIFRKHRVSFSPTHLRLLHRYASTLVIAEHDGGKVKPSSLSAVAAAEAIAEGSSISLLVAGYGPSVQAAANHAATCHPSVSQVLVAETEKLMHPLAEPWAELIHSVQKNHVYSHIVMASSSFGKNVLPRAAAILDVSPVTDVIEIRASRLFVRPIYAGNALSTLCYTGSDPCMLTVRPTSFPPSSCDPRTDAAPVSHVDVSVLSGDSYSTKLVTACCFTCNVVIDLCFNLLFNMSNIFFLPVSFEVTCVGEHVKCLEFQPNGGITFIFHLENFLAFINFSF